jgi:hypothetical protein
MDWYPPPLLLLAPNGLNGEPGLVSLLGMKATGC